MMAVQTCTLVEPRAMNSAASRQLAMPPMPEIGSWTSESAAQLWTMLRAMGFTAGPQYPPWVLKPPTNGSGTRLSRLTCVMLLMVLMREIESAPPFRAARAAYTTSVMFGVSLTITGIVAASMTQLTIFSVTAG